MANILRKFANICETCEYLRNFEKKIKLIKSWRIFAKICKKKKENELNIGKYLQKFAKKKIKLIKYWQIFYGNLRIFPKLCEKEIN